MIDDVIDALVDLVGDLVEWATDRKRKKKEDDR